MKTAVSFIREELKCTIVRISLFHFTDEGVEGAKLHANQELKKFLKTSGFKWKQITNFESGDRVEYMESCIPLTNQISRPGMHISDINKEPMTLKVA